jgi:ABC-2 type transport system ATP-binding protein
MTAADGALVVDDLVVRYGDAEAVSGVSFRIGSGEIFGLLGPNGAGKTSILRVLTTLLRPYAGTASILGHDVGRSARTVRRLIGFVPQAVSADGSLTGRENATLFARLHGLPWRASRTQVSDMLEQMGLTAAGDDLARTYSGGMIRRLEIGCALLGSPRLLLLDEPTIGLDPIARRGVWEQLDTLRTQQGMTILVTTHAMEEAEERCDRVGVMQAGRLLAQGTPDELRQLVDRPDGSLEDVFVALAGTGLDDRRGGLREAARARHTARRLG